MRKGIWGALVAGAALIGGAALAEGDTLGHDPDLVGEEEPLSGTTPGMEMGTGGSGMESHQLTGTVIDTSGNRLLYVEHMGAIVPVKVDRSTKLEGLEGKKLTDLKAGDEVLVTFMVKNRTDNVATRISMGAGGSGFEESEEGQGTGGSTIPGEDTGTVVPDHDPMSHPRDQAIPPRAEDDQPIY